MSNIMFGEGYGTLWGPPHIMNRNENRATGLLVDQNRQTGWLPSLEQLHGRGCRRHVPHFPNIHNNHHHGHRGAHHHHNKPHCHNALRNLFPHSHQHGSCNGVGNQLQNILKKLIRFF